jgi:sugar diacid utilization regulator
VVAIVAHDEEDEADRRANALLLIVQENLMDCPGWSAVIGVGGARRSPAQLHESHIEAQHAVRLGGTVPSLGPVVRWSSLGAYRTLASVVGTRDVSRMVPACVRRLLASDDAAKLVMTLETYLERGGDARATVDALYIHRSSLYQRLHRIEDIAGIDLRSGDARLELQLGLRLWRMSGSFQDVLPPDAYG